MCSTRVKWSPESCPGTYVPAKFLKGWEGIDEELVVVQYKDEYGMDRVEAYPKEEWEQEHSYPYEYHRPEKPMKEKPRSETWCVDTIPMRQKENATPEAPTHTVKSSTAHSAAEL